MKTRKIEATSFLLLALAAGAPLKAQDQQKEVPDFAQPQQNRQIPSQDAVNYTETIRQDIIKDIREDNAVSDQAGNVSVNLENGKFVVKGMVDTERQRDRIMRHAEKRVGKDMADNQIGIRPPQ